MTTFYDVHHQAINRAFNLGTQRPGDYFRVIMWEPIAPVDHPPDRDATATIITFRRMMEGQYEPADGADRKAIADWNERHKHTPTEAWEIPDFSK